MKSKQLEATTKEYFYSWIMESKKRTKKIKDTQKQKEIPKVAEEDNCETMEVQAENSLVGFNLCRLNYFGFF